MNNQRKRRPNLSEIAYDEIKEMILSGEVSQGERILLDEFSERLNLSITPIREALNKLAQEDLIQITPRTSHAVISLDAKDGTDILELRLLLETFAFQTAGDNLVNCCVRGFAQEYLVIEGRCHWGPIPVNSVARFAGNRIESIAIGNQFR